MAIEANSYRILDDTGDPILYDNDEVQIIDSEVPTTWTWEYGDEGEAYAGPNYLTKYVWEDYHDGIHKAVSIINEYVKSVGPCSWQASPDENE